MNPEEITIKEKLVKWNDFMKSQGIGRNERRYEIKRLRKDLEAIDKNVKAVMKEKEQ